MTSALVVGCALGSAMAAAASSVLEHRAARRAPGRASTVFRLLGHLVVRPSWLIGLGLAGVGLGLHAIALSGGKLAVVQPLLVSGVLFALPASLVLEGRKPSARQQGWAAALVIGLATFLLTARPTAGASRIHGVALAATTAIGLAAMAVITSGTLLVPRYRPVLLAVAAGLGYGVAAALLKQTTALAASGAAVLVGSWPLYALVGVGTIAIGLNQVAYRAGPLTASLPALTITDPATSIVIGALAFHEDVAHSGGAIVVELMSFVVMGVATARLAR